MYIYKVKIYDRVTGVTFPQEFTTDIPKLTKAMPTLIEKVEKLNVTDRKPTGSYELVHVSKKGIYHE